MWLSSKVFGLFEVAKESVSALREEVAALRVERDALRTELISVKSNWEWSRVKINQLEYERAALLEKAYNIKLPVPEIARTASNYDLESFSQFAFEDLGDETAKKLGLPTYDN